MREPRPLCPLKRGCGWHGDKREATASTPHLPLSLRVVGTSHKIHPCEVHSHSELSIAQALPSLLPHTTQNHRRHSRKTYQNSAMSITFHTAPNKPTSPSYKSTNPFPTYDATRATCLQHIHENHIKIAHRFPKSRVYFLQKEKHTTT